MRVMDAMLDCVAFLYSVSEGAAEAHPEGTCFFVSTTRDLPDVPFPISMHHLVTADHVADVNEQSELFVRMNKKGGGIQQITIPRGSRWFRHQDIATDIAMLPMSPPLDQFQYYSIPESMFATKETIAINNIGIGDETFTVGLFANKQGDSRNTPIVRIGNIAMMPSETIPLAKGDTDGYLIEARSIGGVSGSPVFVRAAGVLPNWGQGFSAILTINQWHLLGVMHGHWDIDPTESNKHNLSTTNGVNMGIAIVSPSTKILDIIVHDELREIRRRVADHIRNNRPMPKMD